MFEENARLLELAKSGDRKAADELVALNMGLVKSVALRFRERGADYEDLVQIGTIGMLKAIRSFDPSYGTVFSTYAVPLIIGEIKRFLRDDGIIKIGRELKRQGLNVMRTRESFLRENGREPKLSELAALCKMPVEDVTCALEAASPVRSLDEPVMGDDESVTLGGTVSDADNDIDIAADRLALSEAISRLCALHRQIIYFRYYKNLSQQATGEALGLSQVKVSREEKKIILLLRSELLD